MHLQHAQPTKLEFFLEILPFTAFRSTAASEFRILLQAFQNNVRFFFCLRSRVYRKCHRSPELCMAVASETPTSKRAKKLASELFSRPSKNGCAQSQASGPLRPGPLGPACLHAVQKSRLGHFGADKCAIHFQLISEATNCFRIAFLFKSCSSHLKKTDLGGSVSRFIV